MAANLAMVETYEDVERLIYQLVHRFNQRYGGDFRELLSDANLAFMRAYKSYDPSKGQFTTLLVTSVQRLLFRTLKNRIKYQQRYGTTLDEHRTISRDVEEFDFDCFVSNMSADAKFVVRLITHSPPELAAVANGKGGEPRNWRSSIKGYLRDLGWSANQITESFTEIAGFLQ